MRTPPPIKGSDDPVGFLWVAVFLILSVLGIWWIAGPLDAQEAPCQPGYIHYMPLCLTETEYLALTRPPPPTFTSTGNVVALTAEQQTRQIAEYFWPTWAEERMVRIARCESNYLPTARNPRSGAAGLFQIMPGWQRTWPGDYFDPWTNGAVAYQIWLVQGFAAWVCKG